MWPPIQGSQHSRLRSSAMYLSRHGGEIHEALDLRVNPTTYSEQRARFGVIPYTDLEDALKWYREKNPDVPFDVLNCSWDDVFDQMERAKGDYQAKAENPRNPFRWLWRKAGSASEAVQPWLDLIPDEFGLSVARGGIAIIFHMAQMTVEKEEKVFNAFDEITDTIAAAASKGQSFHRNEEMRKHSVRLYVTLLDGIQGLIWTLHPKVEGKNMYERHKQKRERRKAIDIDGMLKRVKQRAVELNQCAERILTEKTLQTHKTAGQMQTELHVVRSTAVDIKVTAEDILDSAKQTGSDVRFLGVAANQFARNFDTNMRGQSNKLDRLGQRLEQDLQAINMESKRLMDSVTAQNLVLKAFADVLNDMNQREEMIQADLQIIKREKNLPRRSRTPVPGYVPAMSLPEFIEALGVPLSLPNNDLRTVLSYGQEFKPRVQRQAQSLLQTREFSRWLGDRFSDLLLVDGNMDSAANDSLSTMSLLCTALIASIENSQTDAIVLHFFCGLHTSPSYEASGPNGMLRALLLQLSTALRTRRKLSLEFIQTEEEIADVESRRLDSLCFVLNRLLMQVPSGTTVFCLIDGISAFEKNYCNFRTDLEYVARSLKRTTANEGLAAPFKVLLTSGCRSTVIARKNIVERWQHVSLLDSGEAGGHDAITERSVGALLSRQVATQLPADEEFDLELVGDDW